MKSRACIASDCRWHCLVPLQAQKTGETDRELLPKLACRMLSVRRMSPPPRVTSAGRPPFPILTLDITAIPVSQRLQESTFSAVVMPHVYLKHHRVEPIHQANSPAVMIDAKDASWTCITSEQGQQYIGQSKASAFWV